MPQGEGGELEVEIKDIFICLCFLFLVHMSVAGPSIINLSGLGHMIKMVAMPISYGKNRKKLLF